MEQSIALQKQKPRLKNSYTTIECNVSHLDWVSHQPTFSADILRVLGPDVLEYCRNMASGFIDFIIRMPFDVSAKIISCLQLEDMINLSFTCKEMHKICNDNELWKIIYARHTPSASNEHIEELANLFGWKKVFFTNKLQLQMQMRRLRLEHTSGSGDEESGPGIQPSNLNSSRQGDSDVFLETPSVPNIY